MSGGILFHMRVVVIITTLALSLLYESLDRSAAIFIRRTGGKQGKAKVRAEKKSGQRMHENISRDSRGMYVKRQTGP